jgi:pimeloyl-ACP methyl ester carboxylesterase
MGRRLPHPENCAELARLRGTYAADHGPDVWVEPGAPGDPLVITFGFAQWQGPVDFDFTGRLRKLQALLGCGLHRIHLRDPRLRWYLHGIAGLGADRTASIVALRRIVDSLSPDRVVTLGQSMGGYGALLYGHELGAQRAVAFGALSTMDPAVAHDNGDLRWMPVMQALVVEGLAPDSTDLVARLQARSSALELRLHYGERPDAPEHGVQNLDLFHARRFAALPACRVTTHADCDHAVVLHLKRQREIDATLLADIFDVDPALLHRRHRPLMDDGWLEWLAHNLLLGADRPKMVEHMLQRGYAALTARSAIAEVEREPAFLAAAKQLQARPPARP